MKLYELDAQRRKEQVAKIFESHLGTRVDFNRLTHKQAHSMLQRVRGLVKEHRASPSFHYSERNPDYMKLVMMEQGLLDVIKEELPTQSAGATGAAQVDPVAKKAEAAAVIAQQKDPRVKQALMKSAKGQSLNPEEQKLVAGVALLKTAESQHRRGRPLSESEVQQAQVVLAAQDMIDQLQKMMEQISEMQFKDLPALTDSIKNDPNLGADKATQYQSQAATALTQLLAAVQQGKMGLEGAQGVLTGQAPMVPGVDTGAPAADMGAAPDVDVDADLELDANLPADDEEGTLPPAASLGRERR